MKKSKIWIRTCVHLLLYITVAAYSIEIGNPITDDIKKVSLLKQNIPKDYKITVHYLPKEVSGMCWVKLNVLYMEESLKELAQKFGNISSNKDSIETFVEMLRELRYRVSFHLEDAMLEFQCHYREEKWLTERYFEFVEDFFNTANSSRDNVDCEPPPCPTTIKTTAATTVTTAAPTAAPTHHLKGSSSGEDTTATPGRKDSRIMPELLERSLLSLLFIPLLAAVFFLIWKMKSRRDARSMQSSTEGPPLFNGTETGAPPVEEDPSENKRLNSIYTV